MLKITKLQISPYVIWLGWIRLWRIWYVYEGDHLRSSKSHQRRISEVHAKRYGGYKTSKSCFDSEKNGAPWKGVWENVIYGGATQGPSKNIWPRVLRAGLPRYVSGLLLSPGGSPIDMRSCFFPWGKRLEANWKKDLLLSFSSMVKPQL